MTVIFSGDPESGDLIPPWTRKTERGVSVVTSPVRTGKYAMKFSVSPGQQQWSTGNERAEILTEEHDERNGDERYYAWSTRLGEDWRSLTGWGVFTQWHGSNQLSPHLSMLIYSNDMIRIGQCVGPNGSYRRDHYTNARMATGVWNDFVVHVKWSQSTNGLVEVWHKTENQTTYSKIFEHTGYTMHSTVSSVSTKHQGLYRSITPYTQVIYHDGYRIGETWDDVVGVQPEPPEPEPPEPEPSEYTLTLSLDGDQIKQYVIGSDIEINISVKES